MGNKYGADIILRWHSGKENVIGTVGMIPNATLTGFMVRPKVELRRFGWGLVREGLRLILRGENVYGRTDKEVPVLRESETEDAGN